MCNWKPVTSCVLQGPVVGPILFHIFIDNIGSGVERPLSKFVHDIKLKDAPDSLEGRDGVQRDLDRHEEEWSHVKLSTFTKAKRKIWHVAWGNINTDWGING